MLTREQLRVARTKFVHRWHAAQTIGERLGNDAVGERFEHVNHARSLAEYVWRYGVFEESADGSGRVARPDMPYGLRDVVAPVAAGGGQRGQDAAGRDLPDPDDASWLPELAEPPGEGTATGHLVPEHRRPFREGLAVDAAPTRKRVEWKELADYIGGDCDSYSSRWAGDAWRRLTRLGLADYTGDDERRIVVIRLIALASVWNSFAGRRNGGQGEPVEDLLSGMARADLLFLAGVKDIADLADIMDPVDHARIAAEYDDVSDVYPLDSEDIVKPIVELIATEYPKLVAALVRAFGDDETLLMSMEADHWTMCCDDEDMQHLQSECPEAAEVIEQALDKQGHLKYEDLFSCDSLPSEAARKEVLMAIARLEGIRLDGEPSALQSCRLLYTDMDWHEHVRFPHFGS